MADDLADTLALESRTGLPEALKVLLEAHPRAGWGSDPGFDGLVRFWLERHLMFRRMLAALTEDARARLDAGLAPDSHRKKLSRMGGMFLQELHMHHGIEDHHYFPALAARDARLDRGFALLDADHHALDGWLNGFADSANAVLKAGTDAAGREATAPLLATLERFDRMLDRHLTDEEDLIVPVILHYGADGLPG